MQSTVWKKIVKIWPNVQDWKLAVLHSVWITKNVSLKMFEISRIGKFFVGKFKNVLKVRQFWDLQTLCFFL